LREGISVTEMQSVLHTFQTSTVKRYLPDFLSLRAKNKLS